jgi:hypothetical protein
MRRVNLNDSRLTIRISTLAKKKAARIAKQRGLSISQLVEELIRHSESGVLTESKLRAILSEEIKRHREVLGARVGKGSA